MSKNLKHKSDQDLHSHLKELVTKERALVSEILHHLAEVQMRHLYSDFKCSSLWEYATTHLGYSAGEAHTRISAMRLICEVPQVEKAIEKGEISLTNVAQAQTYFRKEQKQSKVKISVEEKSTLLESLKGCSTREAKKILITKSETPHIHRESSRVIEDDRVELKFSISKSTEEKLRKLKGRLAHKNLPSQEALFEFLLDTALEKTEPKAPSPDKIEKALSSFRAPQVQKRHIPASIRKYVIKRDQEKCVKCGSEHALQLDHIRRFRNKGSHSPENLRVLCRSCNLRREVTSEHYY